MTIINKVSESGLVTIDPAEFYPAGERAAFDIRPLLVEDVLLREKEFREFVKGHDWTAYDGKHMAVFCSSDAIIPVWAYMLIASALQPHAKTVYFGSIGELEQHLYSRELERFRPDDFLGMRVVIKGCGDVPVPVSAYVELTRMLRPVVKSIMYGEPCSTVPVFKSK